MSFLHFLGFVITTIFCLFAAFTFAFYVGKMYQCFANRITKKRKNKNQ